MEEIKSEEINKWTEEMLKKMFKTAFTGDCVICGQRCTYRLLTCSEECHKKFLGMVVEKFGKQKEVVDKETGKIYLVPTFFIIEMDLSMTS